MRFVVLVIAALLPAPAVAETTLFPALDGEAGARTLVVYSALDVPLAKGMIEGFRRANPSIAVRYEELLTGDIYSRIVEETNAGGKTADMAFSSAMDHPPQLTAVSEKRRQMPPLCLCGPAITRRPPVLVSPRCRRAG